MPQDAPAPLNAALEAPLCFIVPQATKPQFYSSAYTGGDPKVLFEVEFKPVPIGDMRAMAEPPQFEREGFELLVEPTAVDLNDDGAVETRYYPEIEALLKRRFDAARVVIFDATRRSDSGQGANNSDGARGPATRVHVDYTPKSGPQRLEDSIGAEEGERLLASGARIVQVNVWRPIRGPVKRAPLALADASTVEAKDLIATDQIFPDRVGEIYQIAHNPKTRWYYASDMERDEALLIKGWDSADPNGSRVAPHGAFQLPDQDPAPAPRESIEIRTFVIIE